MAPTQTRHTVVIERVVLPEQFAEQVVEQGSLRRRARRLRSPSPCKSKLRPRSKSRPVEQAPVETQAPVQQAPVEQAPVETQAPVQQAPVQQAPVETQAPVQNLAQQAPPQLPQGGGGLARLLSSGGDGYNRPQHPGHPHHGHRHYGRQNIGDQRA